MTAKNRFPAVFLALLSVFMTAVFWADWKLYELKIVSPSRLVRFIPAPAQRLENLVCDLITSKLGWRDGNPKISIAAIDDYSIAKLGWPFPRGCHAELIEKLNLLGAKAIVFDVLFLNPDSRSPEGDKKLVAAAAKAGNIVVAGYIEHINVASGEAYVLRPPYGGLSRAAFALANPNVDDAVDEDGHIRRMRLFDPHAFYEGPSGTGCANCKGLPIASLTAAAYSIVSGKPLSLVFAEEGKRNVRWLNFTDPVLSPAHPAAKDSGGELVIASYPHVSIADILEGSLSPEQKEALKGGIVFVGSTAMGAFDHMPSPFRPTVPGVEFHANLLDNLLAKDELKIPSPAWSWAAMILMIWLSLFALRSSAWTGALVTAAAGFGWFLLFVILYLAKIKIYCVMPLAGLLIAYGFAAVWRAVIEGKEKRWIKTTFGQYLSPKIVDVIVKDPSKLKLGGDQREMTVFFLDIARFTAISEKMNPEELTHFLNIYLSALTDIILKNDGVVDKYIGDCIMAFWNAPLDIKEHKLLGCLSAVECLAAVRELNKNLPPGVPEPPAIRVGINSGQMKVGNMGSATRFSYTVIGDEVNLASRLEGANKFFASSALASEAVYEGAKEKVAAREIGLIRVVGKSTPVRVFELICKKEELSPQLSSALDLYAQGNAHFYKRGFEAAAKFYEEALSLAPGDRVAVLQLERARQFASVPPPEDWDGVFNLTAK